MKKIILIGMGGHCSSCVDVIESSGKFKIVGLVAKNKKVKNKNKKYKIIGTDKDLNNIFKRYKYTYCYRTNKKFKFKEKNF